MATVLGKRKKPSSSGATAADIQDIFRQHFEAQFKPLTVAKKTEKMGKKGKETGSSDNKSKKSATVVIQENESDEDDDGDDDDESVSEDSSAWSGLSDDDEEEKNAAPAVEVVDYSTDATKDEGPETTMTKRERKLYLSSRPPSSFDDDANRAAANKDKNNSKKKGAAADGAATDQYKDAPELLANDLALQRLISESHLLAGAFALPSSFSTSSGAASTFGAAGLVGTANHANHKSSQPFAAGRLRQRATDLRIQAVANKAKGGDPMGDNGNGLITVSRASDSIFTQAKMPMAMRKGMTAAAAARESQRRQEARESGIVLERPVAASKAGKTSSSKRLRAVDAPAVGRMRGSELRLRDRDVREIEGPKKGMGKKKKKRR